MYLKLTRRQQLNTKIKQSLQTKQTLIINAFKKIE